MQINIVGWKFQPSDQLLVGYHLYNKISGNEPLDFETTIQECDLYGEKEPWEIWEMYGGNDGFKPKEDLYFFTRLKMKTLKSKRINRTIGSGTWKGEDSGKPISVGGLEKPIGFKKLFRYEGKSQQNSGWILHEYSLDSWVLQQLQATEYVLCRMRKNTDKRKRYAGALNSNARCKRFKVKETPLRVEEAAEYGLAIGEVGDRDGSLSRQQVLPIEPVGVSTLTMGTTVSELPKGQLDDGQMNIGESDGCSESLEEFPTLKPSGSNTSTTTMQQGSQCLWDIPWDDAFLNRPSNCKLGLNANDIANLSTNE